MHCTAVLDEPVSNFPKWLMLDFKQC